MSKPKIHILSRRGNATECGKACGDFPRMATHTEAWFLRNRPARNRVCRKCLELRPSYLSYLRR